MEELKRQRIFLSRSAKTMIEKTFETSHGPIHYWIKLDGARKEPELVFLPGLTADHRLFDKQIEFFEGKYPVFVWEGM